jgi:hypothetical protein
MAQPPDSTALNAFVGQVVDHATERLKTTGAGAETRQADLTKAKKNAGNRLRSDDIRASLTAEARVAGDSQALAKRMPMVRRSMSADLERLLGVAVGADDVPPSTAGR